MNIFLRVLRLLAIVVWIGGLIFFAFVEAPTAYYAMGTNSLFAQLINGSITALNHFGYVCGVVLLLATALLWMRSKGRGRKLLVAQMLLVLAMLAATLYVQADIVPRMEHDRIAAGGDIDAVPLDNPLWLDFKRLHPLSEQVEGAVLLLGLAVVVLMGFEDGTARPQSANRA